MAVQASIPSSLVGLTLVVTGRLEHYTRAQIEERIRQLGGTVGAGVTRNTDYLIAGADAGSKLAKAEALGVPIASEADFRATDRAAGDVPRTEPGPSAQAVRPRRAIGAQRPPTLQPAQREDPAALRKHAEDLVVAFLEQTARVQHYTPKPVESAAGRELLEGPGALQVAGLHAVIAALRADTAAWARLLQPSDWNRSRKLAELARALLRRRQPLERADVTLLLETCISAHHRYFPFPHGEALRCVERSATAGELGEEHRALLETLRARSALGGWGVDQQRIQVLTQALLDRLTARQGDGEGPEEPPAVISPEATARATHLIEAHLAEMAKRESRVKGLLWWKARAKSAGDETDARRELLALRGVALVAAIECAVGTLAELLFGVQQWPRAEQAARTAALRGLLHALPAGVAELSPGGPRAVLQALAAQPRIWDLIAYLHELLVTLLEAVRRRTPNAQLRADLFALRELLAPYLDAPSVRAFVTQLDVAIYGEQARVVDAVDTWGAAAQPLLDNMDPLERAEWLDLLRYLSTAVGSRPSGKWLSQARGPLDAMGHERFRTGATAFLELLGNQPTMAPSAARTLQQTADHAQLQAAGREGPSLTQELTQRNQAVLKGLAWVCTLAMDDDLVKPLAEAADRCFRKLPGVGPRAASVGSACILTLGDHGGETAIRALQWLRLRVQNLPGMAAIDRALERVAQRTGATRAELEELSVPTFDLLLGERELTLGDYVARVAVEGGNAVSVTWRRADGTAMRGEPAAIKRDFPRDRKALRTLVDDIRSALPVQRDRLERALVDGRSWPYATWRERYLDHPFLSTLVRRLIWCVGTERRLVGWHEDGLVDLDDGRVEEPADDAPVRLWHPLGWDVAVVGAWREWLERHRVMQPFKQAYREVYLLTDAELRTATYSNRFAAHILRQHPFNALRLQRGWRYALQGGFDQPTTGATLSIPAEQMRAEFWVDAIVDGDLNLVLESGISVLVSTDQVRFTRTSGEAVPLADVPALVFSEVMRDVDLFVGVASVGTDPTWADNGPERYRAYWHSYSFGDLSESAKTRHAVLERLLPRLSKIAERCSLTERFLVVRGDVRTYKIHLGSGNILMEPNDQYLCIVPERGPMAGALDGERLHLPFEGDSMLSVILSKAFLLANDRAISDATITHQIRHRGV